MGRPEECAQLLREGLSPSEIGKRIGVSTASAGQYLWRAVGAGIIFPFDIYFSIPRAVRELADKAVYQNHATDVRDILPLLIKQGISFDPSELDMIWVLTTSSARHLGLYHFITGTENTLHKQVRLVLTTEFGSEESGWWRKGVPQSVRFDCVRTRESEPDGAAEPFAYTTLIHLQEIMDKQWRLFQPCLPVSYANNKSTFTDALKRLNSIRNCAMHPTRLDRVTDEDFRFVQEFHDCLKPECWRSPRALQPPANSQ